ncbi:MAG TPA: Uma2 family endonuclease [Bryobacterales bacterium]|nr:Uma2 family endonuclease [Bryobacterales bacterium]
MATSTQLPVEEYLRMSFEGPDREYLDGEVVERTVGGKRHSKVQAQFMRLIDRVKKPHQLQFFPELRMRVSGTRYRIADVAVFSEEPSEEIPGTPPLIVLEIVSRDDRHTEIVEKLAEYRQWGVRNVWLADPYNLMLHVYGEDGLRQVSSLDLAEYDLRIRHEDLF